MLIVLIKSHLIQQNKYGAWKQEASSHTPFFIYKRHLLDHHQHKQPSSREVRGHNDNK